MLWGLLMHGAICAKVTVGSQAGSRAAFLLVLGAEEIVTPSEYLGKA